MKDVLHRVHSVPGFFVLKFCTTQCTPHKLEATGAPFQPPSLTCKHTPLEVLLVGGQLTDHAPQVAPVAGQHVGINHVGVACEVRGVRDDNVEPLAHKVLDLPQEPVQGLDLLTLGQVPGVRWQGLRTYTTAQRVLVCAWDP